MKWFYHYINGKFCCKDPVFTESEQHKLMFMFALTAYYNIVKGKWKVGPKALRK